MGFLFGGQARIRTLEGVCQQIYSLPRLTASVPTRESRKPIKSIKSIKSWKFSSKTLRTLWAFDFQLFYLEP